jgi:hypothetical protein
MGMDCELTMNNVSYNFYKCKNFIKIKPEKKITDGIESYSMNLNYKFFFSAEGGYGNIIANISMLKKNNTEKKKKFLVEEDSENDEEVVEDCIDFSIEKDVIFIYIILENDYYNHYNPYFNYFNENKKKMFEKYKDKVINYVDNKI